MRVRVNYVVQVCSPSMYLCGRALAIEAQNFGRVFLPVPFTVTMVAWRPLESNDNAYVCAREG